MIIKTLRKFLPALTIVLLAFTLLVIVILFTLRNISSQYERMEEFTRQQGVAVIRTLEAGTRTGFLEGGDWGIENLQMLIEQSAKDPDVSWAGLINIEGIIVAHSDPDKIGIRVMPGKELDIIRTVLRTGEPLSETRTLPDGRTIIEIWKPFRPFADQIAESEIIARQTRIGKDLLDVFSKEHDQSVIFLGLKMDRFEEIRHRDIMYAILMGAVIFIIGSAAVYFIFVVQNSLLVRRTLDEMRTYTRNVVESMANGLITVDQSLRVASHNPTALEILGKSSQEVSGRPIADVLPLEAEIRQVLSDPGAIVEKEVQIPDSDRGPLSLGISVSPLKEPDSRVARGAVVIVRDLTEIRELEKKVRVNEKFAALGRLSAGVAHEIRNPLNSIRGFIQYFQKKLPLEEEDYGYTELMLTEVDRLSRVISKLLAYSKPREPRLGLRSVTEVVDHCMRVLEREAGESGIKLMKRSTGDDMPLVMMDTDQITQVFLNILINAIESAPGGKEVFVECRQTDDGNARVTVEDTGEGIPRENMDKLFDPFFSTKKKGTGLGLAIVKSIIEGHRGDIQVESEPGKGTRFIITLNAYREPPEPYTDGSETDSQHWIPPTRIGSVT
ncbi:MAG: ATP-binding protein [Thermodesulfobacteriota bacterium]